MSYPIADDIANVISWQRTQGMRRLGEASLSEARQNRTRVNELLPLSASDRNALSFAKIETSAGKIPVMVARTAKSAPDRIMLYVHGGGWSVGQAQDYASLAIALAKASDFTIVVPDYDLAPEHPFPHGLNQVAALLKTLQSEPAVLQESVQLPKKLVLLGDSSGGNMCAALSLQAAREGRPVDAQLLVYPAIDPADTLENAPEDMPALNRTAFNWFVNMYVPEAHDRLDPRVSPARDVEIGRSPPTVIVTAEHDILNEQIDRYEAQLRHASIPVTRHRIPGTIHTFIQLPGIVAGADLAISLMMQDLMRILSD